LPLSPPRKRTKTSSSTPNLKSPSIRTPSLLKKSLSMVFLFVHLQILPNSLLLTIQWSKEEGQTIQWPKEEVQTIQWSKEGQTRQWSKEEGHTTQ
jgi:hypothetical protein